MAGVSLHSLTGLIVDDHPEMCKQLRSMLDRLGLRKIVTTETGKKAVDIMSRSKFDIVLCDYDLGVGKDGLQVLEEIKHKQFIPNTSCFIMITAIQTGEMVLGAIEYQPDAYIVKPITFDDLRLRLERTLAIKSTYFDVLHNLDIKNYNGALAACDALIRDRPKITLTVLKHKAQIYLTMDRYDKAELIYSEILQIRKLPWAYFGLAKAYFHQNKLTQSASILEKLIEQNNNYTTAYDLLATIRELQGDTKGAQAVLQQALAYSPRAIRRQTYLSKLATENKDWHVALDASRKGVELGRHSCFKDQENYFNLSAALKLQLDSDSLNDRRAASNEILKTMDHLKRDFNSDPSAVIAAHFIQGSTHKSMGQDGESEKAFGMATNIMESHQTQLNEGSIQSITQRLSITCDSDTLKAFIESDICKNLSKQAQQYIEEKAVVVEPNESQAEIDKYNNKGVELFEKGTLTEALEMFEKATEFAAANYSVLLNAMQAHIAYLEANGEDQASLSQCSDLLSRLGEMPPTDRRQARKKRLESIYKKLTEGWH